MTQEIEIEFKTLLEEADFLTLKKALPFKEQPIIQTNHYFDTQEMDLKRQPCALRIREKNQSYTLTLKQPQQIGILETHDDLSAEEFGNWLNNHPVSTTQITSILHDMRIDIEELHYYGSLTTERYSFYKKGLEFVIDKSFYLDRHDYELEIEAPTYTSGDIAFQDLLEKFHIKKQAPVSKIKRFFNGLEADK